MVAQVGKRDGAGQPAEGGACVDLVARDKLGMQPAGQSRPVRTRTAVAAGWPAFRRAAKARRWSALIS